VQRSESNHASQAAIDREMPPPLEGAAAQVLAQIESSELAVRLVPEKVARRHEVVPIAVDNRVLTYATCAPYSSEADRDLGFASGRRTTPVPATRPAVIKGLDQYYPKVSDLDALGRRLRVGLENAKSAASQTETATIEMCTHIVARAVRAGATEVELACDGHGATLRYLIDGVFESELRLPVADAIRDRFKIMARVAVAVRHRPQTGNFRLTLNGQGTAVNLSSRPSGAGETIVIQLVDLRPTATGAAVQSKSGCRRRVLIADDESTTRVVIKRLLEREHFEVLQAQNGDEAVALVTRERPDLVLLDLNMPVMDGYEAIHHLRHNPALTGLPIIVLTAEDGQTIERRVLTMGADDYMVKPFDGPILLSRVNAVFSRLNMRAPS
jgi:two-component system cell cycle response regulator DivK